MDILRSLATFGSFFFGDEQHQGITRVLSMGFPLFSPSLGGSKVETLAQQGASSREVDGESSEGTCVVTPIQGAGKNGWRCSIFYYHLYYT